MPIRAILYKSGRAFIVLCYGNIFCCVSLLLLNSRLEKNTVEKKCKQKLSVCNFPFPSCLTWTTLEQIITQHCTHLISLQCTVHAQVLAYETVNQILELSLSVPLISFFELLQAACPFQSRFALFQTKTCMFLIIIQSYECKCVRINSLDFT